MSKSMVVENDQEYLSIMRPQIEVEAKWSWWCMWHDTDGTANYEGEAMAAAQSHADYEYDGGDPCRVCVFPPKEQR